MNVYAGRRCIRCSNLFKFTSQSPSIHRPTTPFPFRRTLLTRPILQINPPDPNAPPPPPPPPPPPREKRKRDPGVALGDQGIPVRDSFDRTSVEDRNPWTETVFRTLSGGMKSEYLKCICHSSLRRA